MTTIETLSQRLAAARGDQQTLDDLPAELNPVDASAAYAVQHEILQLLGAEIAGWKIGAKSATGPIQGAPLPDHDVYRSGVNVRHDAFTPLGLELEIAFRFGRRFEVASEPYSDAEVRAGIEAMGPTIEIVASRFGSWPNVEKLAQLADLQNNGALIVGEFIPYRDDFPFVSPSMQFSFKGEDVVRAKPANPCGDPRRLLTWLVNHCTVERGIAVTPEMVITAGSYTGMFFPQSTGTAHGRIEGFAPISVTLF